MQQHVKILAILHIVLGGLGLLGALIVMAVFGGLAGVAGMADHADGGLIAGGVLGLIGAVVTVVVLVISLPGLIAGIGLLSFQPWARILTIILSALELPGFPFHTALGIYGLWVLLSNEGTALFQRPAPGYARPI
ncbi:MAG TPA: hypothetical protein VKR43_20380 [Bryobacteraceae bacterium]|nr:hypothetical protein [Bryobacteraceae bacterium]